MLSRIFRRRAVARPPGTGDSRDELRRAVSSVTIRPEDGMGADARARLLRLVAEAVVLQDRAAEVLDEIRDREPLAEVAPRGGPLATRFFELRRQLPPPADREMARQCATVSAVLDHHGTLIVSALEMLSMDWRSPAIVEQLERLDGLGTPAERLDAVYTQLAARRARADVPPAA
jgi:hypothetical protein